jgi:hypothetical protein
MVSNSFYDISAWLVTYICYPTSTSVMSEPQLKKRRIVTTRLRYEGGGSLFLEEVVEEVDEAPCDDCKTLTPVSELNAPCPYQGCDGTCHLGQCDDCRDNEWHYNCEDCTDKFSVEFSGRCESSSCYLCTGHNYRCRDCLPQSHTKCDECGTLTGETRIQCSVCNYTRKVDCCWNRCTNCHGAICLEHAPRHCAICCVQICAGCDAYDGTCSVDCYMVRLDFYAGVIQERLPNVLVELTVNYLK